jgi:hypothetical protein
LEIAGVPQAGGAKPASSAPRILLALVGFVFGAVVVTGLIRRALEPKFSAFTSTEGRFKAQFPGDPKHTTQSRDGLVLEEFAVEVAVWGKAAFGIAYIDFPSKQAADFDTPDLLDKMVQGAVQGMKGTLIDQKTIAIGATSGREFNATVAGGRAHGRLVLMSLPVGMRAFTVVAVEPDATPVPPAAIRRFLDGFAPL